MLQAERRVERNHETVTDGVTEIQVVYLENTHVLWYESNWGISQQPGKPREVCFADGREPKFVLGIVLLDQVMSELVGESEEPGFNHLICTGRQ